MMSDEVDADCTTSPDAGLRRSARTPGSAEARREREASYHDANQRKRARLEAQLTGGKTALEAEFLDVTLALDAALMTMVSIDGIAKRKLAATLGPRSSAGRLLRRTRTTDVFWTFTSSDKEHKHLISTKKPRTSQFSPLDLLLAKFLTAYPELGAHWQLPPEEEEELLELPELPPTGGRGAAARAGSLLAPVMGTVSAGAGSSMAGVPAGAVAAAAGAVAGAAVASVGNAMMPLAAVGGIGRGGAFSFAEDGGAFGVCTSLPAAAAQSGETDEEAPAHTVGESSRQQQMKVTADMLARAIHIGVDPRVISKYSGLPSRAELDVGAHKIQPWTDKFEKQRDGSFRRVKGLCAQMMSDPTVRFTPPPALQDSFWGQKWQPQHLATRTYDIPSELNPNNASDIDCTKLVKEINTLSSLYTAVIARYNTCARAHPARLARVPRARTDSQLPSSLRPHTPPPPCTGPGRTGRAYSTILSSRRRRRRRSPSCRSSPSSTSST